MSLTNPESPTHLGQRFCRWVVLLGQGDQNTGDGVLQRQHLLWVTEGEFRCAQDVVDVVHNLAVQQGDAVVLVPGTDLVQSVEQLGQQFATVAVDVVVQGGYEGADFTDDVVRFRVVRLQRKNNFEVSILRSFFRQKLQNKP